MNITSTLVKNGKVKHIGSIPVSDIIGIYKSDFDMDVSRFFKEKKDVDIYQCEESGYQFYFPSTLAGDDFYYREMGKFSWYYNPKRWEHDFSLSILKKSDNILEVGSGSGFFLKRLQENGFKGIGLELNKDEIKKGKEKGLTILDELIEAHAEKHSGEYDVVCSYQVLEHVYNVQSFLEGNVKCLKKGGRLIIGIPNNDSYLSYNILNSRVLNYPPHHVGLWRPSSIKSLEKYFPLKLTSLNLENVLDSNSLDIYLWNLLYKKFKTNLVARIIWKLKLREPLIKLLHNHFLKVNGPVMVAVFEKI